MRGLRIVASTQLRLHVDEESAAGHWEDLPEATRASVLALLARLIAKGVVDEEDEEDEVDD